MKDNLQNIADLIGALAEDIEAIKKKLDAKDSPDKAIIATRLLWSKVPDGWHRHIIRVLRPVCRQLDEVA